MNDTKNTWLTDAFGQRPFPWEADPPPVTSVVSVFDHWLDEDEVEKYPLSYVSAVKRGQQKEFEQLAEPLRDWFRSLFKSGDVQLLDDGENVLRTKQLDEPLLESLLDDWLQSDSEIILGVPSLEAVLLCSYDLTVLIYLGENTSIWDSLPKTLHRLN